MFRKRPHTGCVTEQIDRLPEEKGNRCCSFPADHLRQCCQVILLVGLTLIGTGCTPTESDSPVSSPEKKLQTGLVPQARGYQSIPEFELTELVSTTQEPVLVEFGVDFNCPRCEQMAPVLNDLGERFGDQVKIVRSSYDRSSTLQAQLGLNVCPSYLIYLDGNLVDRHVGPAMLPVLSSKLLRLVPESSPKPDLAQPFDADDESPR